MAKKRVFKIGEKVLFHLNHGYVYGEKINGVVIDIIERFLETNEYIVEYVEEDKTNVIALTPKRIYRDLRN